MIVEADLPDGPRAGCVDELPADDLGRDGRSARELVGLMRVYADGEPDVGPDLLETPCLRRLLCVSGRENDERALEACTTSARHDLFQVGRKHVVCEVAVAVD